MIRESLQIEVTPLETGAAVKFPKDEAMIRRFRARFPKAIWGAGTRSWHIPGRLAAKRAAAWAAEEQPRLVGEEHRLRNIEWERSAPTAPPLKRGPVRGLTVACRWAGRATHPMPSGEYERIKTAIADLSARTENASLFGFLDRWVMIWIYWTVHPDEISIAVGPGLVNGHTNGWTIGWRWTDIYHGDDWCVSGWHPDKDIWGVPLIASALWDAMNPGKRIRPGGLQY